MGSWWLTTAGLRSWKHYLEGKWRRSTRRWSWIIVESAAPHGQNPSLLLAFLSLFMHNWACSCINGWNFKPCWCVLRIPSIHRPYMPYNITSLAKDTIALLDDLGWKRFHLVGISMGGMVSLMAITWSLIVYWNQHLACTWRRVTSTCDWLRCCVYRSA